MHRRKNYSTQVQYGVEWILFICKCTIPLTLNWTYYDHTILNAFVSWIQATCRAKIAGKVWWQWASVRLTILSLDVADVHHKLFKYTWLVMAGVRGLNQDWEIVDVVMIAQCSLQNPMFFPHGDKDVILVYNQGSGSVWNTLGKLIE